MKQIVLLAFPLLLAIGTHAQCDLHTKTDNFTNKTTVWTDKVKITTGGTNEVFKHYGDNCRYKIYFKLILQDGKVFLCMSEDSDECTCAIQKVALKFKDGKVLMKTNFRTGQTMKTTLGEEWFTFFELTNDDLTQLSSNPITRFRFTLPGCSDHPALEEEMDDKDADEIRNFSQCLLQNLGGKQ